jgi:N-acetylmuramoyl-L-alanine amidase
MPDRDGSGSRWSGARKREELQRQRALEREQAKQVRLAREAGETPDDSGGDPGRRRLTDEERRTIRQYRFPSADDEAARPEAPGDYPLPPTGTAPAEPPPGGDAPRVSTTPVGTKWRDSAPPGSTGGGGPSLPDLPGDEGGGGRQRPGNSRLLIFGLALFAIMIALAFTPLGPFGNDGDPETPARPTPNPSLPSIFDTEEADDPSQTGVDDPDEVAQTGQPIVCIDAGHGGWDTGWNRTDQEGQETGPYGPPIVTEAEINLGMAYMLKAELEDLGYFVVMTRPGGASVNLFEQDVNGDGQTRLDAENTEQAGARDELQARINVCNEAGADILISLHIDGFDDPSARGFQVIYTAEREFGEQNALLATLISRQMTAASVGTDMENTDRGARPDTDMEIVRYEFGTSQHYLITGPAVPDINITPSEMPGVIIEGAFLSNDLDAIWMSQPNNQRLWAEAYALGIQDYFEQYPPEG